MRARMKLAAASALVLTVAACDGGGGGPQGVARSVANLDQLFASIFNSGTVNPSGDPVSVANSKLTVNPSADPFNP